MIENTNQSKEPVNGELLDIKKYIGVASINVLSINPNNETLRKYGWNIKEDAPEPEYAMVKDVNGKPVRTCRVRFLVQIQDLPDKPIVPMDFWCDQTVRASKDGQKFEIIDAYGRAAWGTKQEILDKKIPLTSTGNVAKIATPYKPCHRGERDIVEFLFKYLNITPFEVWDRFQNCYVVSKNPGRLTIDEWNAICSGDVRELARYVSMQPDNRVKVVLGIRTTEDNKAYQTFLNTGYIGNGATPAQDGEYASARKLIDKFNNGRENTAYTFSAAPVKEWTVTASENIVDQSASDFTPGIPTVSDLPDAEGGLFEPQPDDLPFGD
ncbi:MAG: hypothetical protein II661_10435 [Bacteroidales bacterium]|nr:hypothetical protein [Bacteroidales bacterium]